MKVDKSKRILTILVVLFTFLWSNLVWACPSKLEERSRAGGAELHKLSAPSQVTALASLAGTFAAGQEVTRQMAEAGVDTKKEFYRRLSEEIKKGQIEDFIGFPCLVFSDTKDPSRLARYVFTADEPYFSRITNHPDTNDPLWELLNFFGTQRHAVSDIRRFEEGEKLYYQQVFAMTDADLKFIDACLKNAHQNWKVKIAEPELSIAKAEEHSLLSRLLCKCNTISHHPVLLGICPMSDNIIVAQLEVAKEDNSPVLFVATPRQIDYDGGYTGYTHKDFRDRVYSLAKGIGFNGPILLEVDHGGPWQSDEDRNAKISKTEAMDKAKKTFESAILAGFNILHIDATVDPHVELLDLEEVVKRTIELIVFCEEVRIREDMPPIAYEVGTEEIEGGLTGPAKFELFIKRLFEEVYRCKFPDLKIDLIVGQVGTRLGLGGQIGRIDIKQADMLNRIAARYGIGIKLHSTDYSDNKTLRELAKIGVAALNIGPEFSAVETMAYIELEKFEKEYLRQINAQEKVSNLYNVVSKAVYESRRWVKWVKGEGFDGLSDGEKWDRLSNKQREMIIVECGRYVYGEEDVKKAVNILCRNIVRYKIKIDGLLIDNPNRYVINAIKRSVKRYIRALNLKGINYLIEPGSGMDDISASSRYEDFGKRETIPVFLRDKFTMIERFFTGGTVANTFLAVDDKGRKVIVKYADWDGIGANGIPWLKSQFRRLRQLKESIILPYLDFIPDVYEFYESKSPPYAFYTMQYFQDAEPLTEYLLNNPDKSSPDDILGYIDRVLGIMFKYFYSEEIYEPPEGYLEQAYFKRIAYRLDLFRQRKGAIYNRLIKGHPILIGNKKYNDMTCLADNLLEADTILINGREYPNLPKLLSMLKTNKRLLKRLKPSFMPRYFHGDLILRNILRDDRDILHLIDVRGLNLPEHTPSNVDIVYDLGKLMHSFLFELIRHDMFSLTLREEEQKGTFEFTFDYCRDRPEVRNFLHIHEILLNHIAGIEETSDLLDREPGWREKVRFSEAMQFIADSFNRMTQDASGRHTLAYYATATMLLYNFMCSVGLIDEESKAGTDGYILNLKSGECKKTSLSGGKGASLAELSEIVDVPEGFIVSTTAYEKFISANNILPLIEELERLSQEIRALPSGASDEDKDALDKRIEAQSAKIRRVIETALVPIDMEEAIVKAYNDLRRYTGIDNLSVAVRSSATTEDLQEASFAGQHDSFLNQRNAGQVVDSVKKCWASLFTDRAVDYRNRLKFSHLGTTKMAVVVQRMIDAKVSGVGFNADLTTGYPGILISANYGLGESVVGGDVNVDNWLLEPEEFEIIRRRKGDKRQTAVYSSTGGGTVRIDVPMQDQAKYVLSSAEVKEVALKIKEIGKFYGMTIDVEFAIDKNGKLYFVQARPAIVQTEVMGIKKEAREKATKILEGGVAASSGCAAGKVKVINNYEELESGEKRIGEDDIVVAVTTHDEWTKYIMGAKAIITDMGDFSSHASIIARERNIPCLVGAIKATDILKDGMEITVDANKAIVYEGRLPLEDLPVSQVFDFGTRVAEIAEPTLEEIRRDAQSDGSYILSGNEEWKGRPNYRISGLQLDIYDKAYALLEKKFGIVIGRRVLNGLLVTRLDETITIAKPGIYGKVDQMSLDDLEELVEENKKAQEEFLRACSSLELTLSSMQMLFDAYSRISSFLHIGPEIDMKLEKELTKVAAAKAMPLYFLNEFRRNFERTIEQEDFILEEEARGIAALIIRWGISNKFEGETAKIIAELKADFPFLYKKLTEFAERFKFGRSNIMLSMQDVLPIIINKIRQEIITLRASSAGHLKFRETKKAVKTEYYPEDNTFCRWLMLSAKSRILRTNAHHVRVRGQWKIRERLLEFGRYLMQCGKMDSPENILEKKTEEIDALVRKYGPMFIRKVRRGEFNAFKGVENVLKEFIGVKSSRRLTVAALEEFSARFRAMDAEAQRKLNSAIWNRLYGDEDYSDVSDKIKCVKADNFMPCDVVGVTLQPIVDLEIRFNVDKDSNVSIVSIKKNACSTTANTAQVLANLGKRAINVALLNSPDNLDELTQWWFKELQDRGVQILPVFGSMPGRMNIRIIAIDEDTQRHFEWRVNTHRSGISKEDAGQIVKCVDSLSLGENARWLDLAGESKSDINLDIYRFIINKAREIKSDLKISYTPNDVPRYQTLSSGVNYYFSNMEEFCTDFAAEDNNVISAGEIADRFRKNGYEGLVRAVDDFRRRKYIDGVVITLGEDGAVLVTEEKKLYAKPPKITPVSTVGAGDASRAAFISAILEHMNVDDALRTSMAAGAAAVMNAGTEAPSYEQISKFYQDIEIHTMHDSLSEDSPFYGVYLQNENLKRALADPSHYYDLVTIVVKRESLPYIVSEVSAARGKAIPFNSKIVIADSSDSSILNLSKILKVRQSENKKSPVILVYAIDQDIEMPLSAIIQVLDALSMAGLDFENTNSAMILSGGKGARCYPLTAADGMGNKGLTKSINGRANIYQALIQLLQFYQPKSYGIVISPVDKVVSISRPLPEFGRQDVQVFGSTVSTKHPELNRHGKVEVGHDGTLLNLFKKGSEEETNFMKGKTKLAVNNLIFLYLSPKAISVILRKYQEEPLYRDRGLDINQDLLKKKKAYEGLEFGFIDTGEETIFMNLNSIMDYYKGLLELFNNEALRALTGIRLDARGALIGEEVQLGKDVVIEPGAVILGRSKIENGIVRTGGVVIDSRIRHVDVGKGSMIAAVEELSQTQVSSKEGELVCDVRVREKSGDTAKIRIISALDIDPKKFWKDRCWQGGYSFDDISEDIDRRATAEFLNPKDIAAKRVGLTGGAGFIGAQFIKFLTARGYKSVEALRRSPVPGMRHEYFTDSGKVHMVETQVLDTSALNDLFQNNDVVFHLAAWSKSGDAMPEKEDMFVTNCISTALMVRFAKKYGRRLVFTSSAAVYQAGVVSDTLISEEELILREDVGRFVEKAVEEFTKYGLEFESEVVTIDDARNFVCAFLETNPIPQGISLYGLTKIIGERLVLKHNNSICLRLADVYGPGDKTKRMIPSVFRYILEGERECKVKDDAKQFIYIDDVIRVLESCVWVQTWDNSVVVNVPGVEVIRTFDAAEMIKRETVLT